MKVNMEDPNPGQWFDVPGDEDGARLKIRELAPGVLIRINRQTRGPEIVSFEQGDRVVTYDQTPEQVDERDELTWDYCIEDWENIWDEGGNPVECTKENKAVLMREKVTLGLFVAACLRVIIKGNQALEQELEKNL